LRSRTRSKRYRARRVPFQVLRSRNRSKRYRARRVPFQVLRSRTRFRRNRALRVPFSGFAHPDSFSAVPCASGSVFTFGAPGLVFGGTERVGPRFHILHSRTRSKLYLARRVPFQVLHSRTRFWWYRACRAPFSRFALPHSFSAVQCASSPVFRFCAPGLVFSGTERVGPRFQVSLSRTRLRRYRALRFHFHVLRFRTRFRRYRVHRAPFSSFALPDSFSAVKKASGPVSTFCAHGHVFGSSDRVWPHFHVLRSRARFRRHRPRRTPF